MDYKEALKMTEEEFKKQSRVEQFEAFEQVKPFKPNELLREYIEKLNKVLKKDFQEKMPLTWLELYLLVGRIYTDVEAKTPLKVPYELRDKVAESYGFKVEPGAKYGLLGRDLVRLPNIYKFIVDYATQKEGENEKKNN